MMFKSLLLLRLFLLFLLCFKQCWNLGKRRRSAPDETDLFLKRAEKAEVKHRQSYLENAKLINSFLKKKALAANTIARLIRDKKPKYKIDEQDRLGYDYDKEIDFIRKGPYCSPEATDTDRVAVCNLVFKEEYFVSRNLILDPDRMQEMRSCLQMPFDYAFEHNDALSRAMQTHPSPSPIPIASKEIDSEIRSPTRAPLRTKIRTPKSLYVLPCPVKVLPDAKSQVPDNVIYLATTKVTKDQFYVNPLPTYVLYKRGNIQRGPEALGHPENLMIVEAIPKRFLQNIMPN